MNETREQHRAVSEGPCGKDRRKSSQMPPASRTKTFIAALSITLPAILFYTILFRNVLDLPILDDYGAVLNFLNQITPLKNTSAMVSYFLASQHGEYKLFFTQIGRASCRERV